MSAIGVIDLIGFFSCIIGIVALSFRWPSVDNKNTRILVLGLILWTLFYTGTNWVEWSGVYKDLADFEDYFQITSPIVWAFFFYSYLMAMEIAEREKNESLFKKSEERLSLAIEGANLGLWDWDIPSGKIHVNAEWRLMLGIDPKATEEIDVSEMRELIHPDDAEGVVEILQDHFSGITSRFECEIRMRHREGRWVWLLDRGKVFARDENNNPLRMAGTHQDITERKRTMESVKNEAKRRAILMDICKDGIAIINQKHEVIEANRGFSQMLGYAHDEVIGLKTWDWEANMSAAVIRATFHDLTQVNEIFETRHRRKDGSTYPVEVSAGGAMIDGKAFVITISRDISERKEIERSLLLAKEEAETASKTKSEFLANMSHEIRTPLNGIYGMLQNLQLLSPTSEQEECIDLAITSTKRLTTLLNDILDLSRIEAGKIDLHESDFYIEDVVSSIIDVFGALAKKKGLDLDINMEGASGHGYIGDESRIRQILFNLVGNAIKFTQAGSVSIEAYYLSDLNFGFSNIVFIVRDTGIGISESGMKSIFEPFSQIESSFTRRFQGAGLGLSIVKRLINLMQGELCIDSAEGEGTSISFTLPVKSVCRFERRDEHDVKRFTNQKAIRILLAEDEEINMLSTKIALEKSGYLVDSAVNGQAAIDKLREHDYDLIIMDIQMPILNGVEATKIIRSSKDIGLKSRIPIIALTSYAMSGDREKLLEAGMSGYLSKPVDRDEMLKQIKRVLDRYEYDARGRYFGGDEYNLQ